jgi:CelD/BcsL family acetyltransferase involved in cellulose biosynthesis
MGGARTSTPTLVYTEHRGRELTTVAVLVPRPLRLLGHPGMPWLGRLQTYRLAGNQLLGCADLESAGRFLDTVAHYLTKDGADCIYVDDLDQDTPLWQAMSERKGTADVLVAQPRSAQSHWRIRFPEAASQYWTHISGKSRYKARLAARRFAHEVWRYTGPQDVDAFLTAAGQVSERSWQGRRLGLRLGPSERYRAHFQALARLGALRSYVLHHQDRPAAFVYGWQWNGRFEYADIGYDPALADHAPGRVLLYRVLEDLVADRTPHELDFGCGDAEYKRSFGTHETMSGPMVIASHSVKAQLWSGLHQTRAVVDRGMRELLQRTGLYEQARRLYRSF